MAFNVYRDPKENPQAWKDQDFWPEHIKRMNEGTRSEKVEPSPEHQRKMALLMIEAKRVQSRATKQKEEEKRAKRAGRKAKSSA